MIIPVYKIIKRLNALLHRPNPKEIFYINFAVTYSCNSKCMMCNIWQVYKNKPSQLKEEMSFAEIAGLFNSSSALKNIKHIHLTGGEPFLRPDFVDIVGFFIKKYPAATIFIPTNSLSPSLVIKKIDEIFKRFSPDPRMIHIGFSLDGIGETHNRVRGKNNSYDKALEGIEKIRKKIPALNCNINFTITPDNFKDLLKVYQLSKKNGVKFGTQFAQVSDSYYGNADLTCSLTQEELQEIGDCIDLICLERNRNLGLMYKMGDMEGFYLSKLTDFQRNPRRLFRCFSATHSFFLDPFGNVFPCIILPRKLGNVRTERFDDIWFSQMALRVREDIASAKCYCWTGCEVIPSLQRDCRMFIKNQMNFIKRLV